MNWIAFLMLSALFVLALLLIIRSLLRLLFDFVFLLFCLLLLLLLGLVIAGAVLPSPSHVGGQYTNSLTMNCLAG
jgi:hypothetical protein